MFAYFGRNQNLKDLKDSCTKLPQRVIVRGHAGLVIIKLSDAGLYCGPRLRKGEVFAYVGLPQNLKDLKDLRPKGPKGLKD